MQHAFRFVVGYQQVRQNCIGHAYEAGDDSESNDAERVGQHAPFTPPHSRHTRVFPMNDVGLRGRS